MLTKRIIPCLDVKDGRVVKGKGFLDLRDAGDPAELAARYDREGADELALLDITASCEQRQTTVEVVRKVAKGIGIPLTVGGGVRTVEDIQALLNAGADKVSINTAAVLDKTIISRARERFGSQCIVVAIDARKGRSGWEVCTEGGRIATGMDALVWAKEAESLGAGEILLTSMDADGRRQGYDLELTRRVAAAARIPVIASGGAKDPQSILEVLRDGRADAALVASAFHYGDHTIRQVKEFLAQSDMEVRR